MAQLDTATLARLKDTGHTVANPDEDVRGRTVKDSTGEDIGKIDDLLIDSEEHKVRFLVIDAGGFLGIGETESFIPVDAVTRITPDEVHVDQSREHIAGAPRYNPDLAVEDHDYYDSLYGYYGYAPFWGPGYVYPGFPYYPH